MENKKRSTSHITRRFERTFLPHGGNPPQLDANQPIPAVDELNLDDRAKKYVKDGYSCLPKNCVLSHEDYLFNEEEAYKIGWNDSTHHNHASFVALVEGEIGFYQDASKASLSFENKNQNDLIADALTDLLNKIKK